MSEKRGSKSREIHDALDHPIVDGDGHWLELSSVLRDYVADVGGEKVAEQFDASPMVKYFDDNVAGFDPNAPLDVRRDAWVNRILVWGLATRNTLDRATAHLPALMAERLDEMGIDVALVYPSLGIHLPRIPEADLRQAACRAYNAYAKDEFAPHSDRLLPVAMIPMETPAEALDALDHAVTVLGYKAVLLQQFSSRPIPNVERERPELRDIVARPDYYALDSAFDYDPVWAKCVELGVAATFHAVGGGRAGALPGSVSNQIFNRVGSIGAVHHRTAAAFALGGVTRRFPTLNVAFLEGGVAWACALFADLVGIWSKRNLDALGNLDPAHLDRDLLFQLIEKYGSDRVTAHLPDLQKVLAQVPPRPDDLDEFASMDLTGPEDFVDLFASRFYFGCEGDDAMNALAFRSEMLPFDAALRPFYGSDISHWDVPDMSECLEEAFEPVEEGVMTTNEFRKLMFEYPVRLHADMNPRFFEGTRVESAVASLLGA